METKKPKLSTIIIYILFSSLTFISIIYAARSRTWNDYLHNSVIIVSITIVIFLLSGLVAKKFKLKFEKPTKGDLIMIIPPIIGLILIGPFYYSFGVAIKDFYLWLQSPKAPQDWAMLITIVATLSIGYFVFQFRLRARILYGMTEAGIGVLIAVHKVSSEFLTQKADTNFYIAFLTASIYLIVRGFDNIDQGYKSSSEKSFRRKTFTFRKTS